MPLASSVGKNQKQEYRRQCNLLARQPTTRRRWLANTDKQTGYHSNLTCTFFYDLLLPLRLSLSLSLSLYLLISLPQSWCLRLSRCITRKKGNKGGRKQKLFIYLFIYKFINLFVVLYGGTSGLHTHTHGHAWLGVVCCCRHVAVGMLYVAMVSSLFISVSQSPTSRCGLPSK